jgi:hypothetical protein
MGKCRKGEIVVKGMCMPENPRLRAVSEFSDYLDEQIESGINVHQLVVEYVRESLDKEITLAQEFARRGE